MLTFNSIPFTTGKDPLKKLTYRLKATKTLCLVRFLLSSGLIQEAARINKVAKWYHHQALEFGYNSESFINDLAEINSYEGRFFDVKIGLKCAA